MIPPFEQDDIDDIAEEKKQMTMRNRNAACAASEPR
jgi:hypothetical protein